MTVSSQRGRITMKIRLHYASFTMVLRSVLLYAVYAPYCSIWVFTASPAHCPGFQGLLWIPLFIPMNSHLFPRFPSIPTIPIYSHDSHLFPRFQSIPMIPMVARNRVRERYLEIVLGSSSFPNFQRFHKRFGNAGKSVSAASWICSIYQMKIQLDSMISSEKGNRNSLE
jgi:hypothetical protein